MLLSSTLVHPLSVPLALLPPNILNTGVLYTVYDYSIAVHHHVLWKMTGIYIPGMYGTP